MAEIKQSSDAILEQLTAQKGLPVRVTLLDDLTHERMVRVTGIIAELNPSALTVECLSANERLAENASATLEIIDAGRTVWWQSVLLRRTGERLEFKIPDEMQTTQRRRFPRIDLQVSVRLLVPDQESPLSAILRDLSAGGAALQSDHPVTDGARVVLVFALGSGLFFEDVHGEVIRCSHVSDGKNIIALRFQCDRQQQEVLEAWVSRQIDQVLQQDQSERVT